MKAEVNRTFFKKNSILTIVQCEEAFKDRTSFIYKVKISIYFNLRIYLLLEALVPIEHK